jgi:NAD(P)H-hydrate epimerase
LRCAAANSTRDVFMEVLTGQQMKNVDRRAIDEMGIAGLLLMESAGQGIAMALLEDFPEELSRGLLIVCGKGNNGGDGFVVGRHLRRLGFSPRVLLLARAEDIRGDAAVNLRAARASGVEIEELTDAAAWDRARPAIGRAGIVLDAILGTGITGGARGLAARVIEDLNASSTPLVALDVPSGLDADSTSVPGVAIEADHTYTLCRPKLPLVSGAAAGHAGRWSVVPIGIPDEAVRLEGAGVEWLDTASVRPLLSERAPDTHKGTYGHLLAIAGSRGKSGAAVLLGLAALRSGVGLMTVAVPRGSLPTVACGRAEIMTEALAETAAGNVARGAVARALRLAADRDALAIGPGLGTSPDTRQAVLSVLSKRPCPAVVDADALNILAAEKRLTPAALASRSSTVVITPHPGEAARLLRSSAAEVQADRMAAARALARKTGAIVVLKGHRTLIGAPDGRVAVNSTGNPGMATAGTGDVLTGMIGAFLARGMEGWDAARLAAYLHGDAGDRAASDLGPDGLIAGDLVSRIPESMKALLTQDSPSSW